MGFQFLCCLRDGAFPTASGVEIKSVLPSQELFECNWVTSNQKPLHPPSIQSIFLETFPTFGSSFLRGATQRLVFLFGVLDRAQCMGFPPYSVIKEEETECIVPGTCIELLVNFSYTVVNFHGLMLDRYGFCATCAGLCRQRHSSWEAAIQKERICFFFSRFCLSECTNQHQLSPVPASVHVYFKPASFISPRVSVLIGVCLLNTQSFDHDYSMCSLPSDLFYFQDIISLCLASYLVQFLLPGRAGTKLAVVYTINSSGLCILKIGTLPLASYVQVNF